MVWGAGGALLRLLLMGVGIIAATLFVLAVSHGMSGGSLPDSRTAGALLAVSVTVLVISYAVLVFALSSVRSLFLKYASQSTDHTSVIILKEVLKTKTELGVLLMLALLMPSLAVFTQSTMVITDWNDAVAASHRVDANYYVPCYLWAFPPYRSSFAESNKTCSFASSLDPTQRAYFQGESLKLTGYVLLKCIFGRFFRRHTHRRLL